MRRKLKITRTNSHSKQHNKIQKLKNHMHIRPVTLPIQNSNRSRKRKKKNPKTRTQKQKRKTGATGKREFLKHHLIALYVANLCTTTTAKTKQNVPEEIKKIKKTCKD